MATAQINTYEEPQDENLKDLGDYIALLNRHRKLMFITFVTIFVVSITIALLLPPTYRASSTILIEEQDIPGDLVRSTITSFASQRIQVIKAKVMTRTNLDKLIRKFNLYAEERKKKTTEEVVDQMRRDTSLAPISADVIDPHTGKPTEAIIAFQLTYENRNPGLALKVANELTTLYLDENLKSRTEQAAEASRFLTEEADRIAKQISELEEKLAVFKEKQGNSLPEYRNFNVQLVQRLERDITDTQSQIHSLEDREFYLKGQLVLIEPYAPATSDDGKLIQSPGERLKALQNEYIRLANRYHENHPDLEKMRREIESLEKTTGPARATGDRQRALERQQEQLRVLSEKYRPNHPQILSLRKSIATLQADLADAGPGYATTTSSNVDPDNPMYVTLNAQLDGVRNDIRANRSKLAKYRRKLEETENELSNTPQVEREYLALSRDHNNATMKFREIKAKQMEANIAQELERENKGERFSLIEAPALPEQPVSPNRPLIIALGFFLAAAAAVAMAFVRDTMAGAIHTGKDIAAVIGTQPLAVIPYLENEAEIAKRKKTTRLALLAILIIVVAALAAIHFLYSPLDVMWFRVNRKVDLMMP